MKTFWRKYWYLILMYIFIILIGWVNEGGGIPNLIGMFIGGGLILLLCRWIYYRKKI